jgi:hypothetical protein
MLEPEVTTMTGIRKFESLLKSDRKILGPNLPEIVATAAT